MLHNNCDTIMLSFQNCAQFANKVWVMSWQWRWEVQGVDILGRHCTYYIGEALQGRSTVHAPVILHSTCPSNSRTMAAWTGRHYQPSVSCPPPIVFGTGDLLRLLYRCTVSGCYWCVCAALQEYKSLNAPERLNCTKHFAMTCQSCLRGADKERFDNKSMVGESN